MDFVVNMTGDDIITARTIAIEKMEFYIQESIYYRSYSSHMDKDKKIIVWNIEEESGKASIK